MKTIAFIKSLLLISTLAAMTSCASVPMASAEQDAASKTFALPAANKAGIYVYRDGSIGGAALKKTLSIDGVEIGETAKGVYFHREVPPGEHTLATESEFGDNELKFTAAPGKNHFFQQYIKFGVFSGGSGVKAVSEEEGKKAVLECKEAIGVTATPASAQKVKDPQP